MKFIDLEQEFMTNFCFITRSSWVVEFLYDPNLATEFLQVFSDKTRISFGIVCSSVKDRLPAHEMNRKFDSISFSWRSFIFVYEYWVAPNTNQTAQVMRLINLLL